MIVYDNDSQQAILSVILVVTDENIYNFRRNRLLSLIKLRKPKVKILPHKTSGRLLLDKLCQKG